MRVLIIGYGIVGRNMAKVFPEAWVIDPVLGMSTPTSPADVPYAMSGSVAGQCEDPPKDFDVAFVCVPTPPRLDGSCDTSIVERAVRENSARVFCIRSTIPPGTTERIARETGKRCVFSPEYYGATVHCNGYDFPFVILGGDRPATDAVAEVYKEKYTGEFRIMKTDSRTAELVKYGENAFLAAKVTFFNEFFRIAEAMGVDADEFRELLLLDPRIGRSHTFAYREHPFYASKCLDKDVPGIIEASKAAGYDPRFLRSVRDVNDFWRR